MNTLTIKNMYPLSQINDLFDQLKGEEELLNIDMGSRYHQVHIKEEDLKKTAVHTRYENYEFMVVPFGLSEHRF